LLILIPDPVESRAHKGITGNSTFEYDEKNNTFKCCSTNDKPPEILLAGCGTAPMCQATIEASNIWVIF